MAERELIDDQFPPKGFPEAHHASYIPPYFNRLGGNTAEIGSGGAGVLKMPCLGLAFLRAEQEELDAASFDDDVGVTLPDTVVESIGILVKELAERGAEYVRQPAH